MGPFRHFIRSAYLHSHPRRLFIPYRSRQTRPQYSENSGHTMPATEMLPRFTPADQAAIMTFVNRKPIDHLAVLQKFIYRLETHMSIEDRARLEGVIATYQRLYVPG